MFIVLILKKSQNIFFVWTSTFFVLRSDLLTQAASLLLAKAGGGFPSTCGSVWEAPVRAVVLLGQLLSFAGGAESSASGWVGSTWLAGKGKHVVVGRVCTVIVTVRAANLHD